MKAPPFSYLRASTIDEVIDALQEYGDAATILAGGQSLMPSLNMRLSSPELLIDINGVHALSGISRSNNCLRIGAMTRQTDIELSDMIAQHAPLLSLAMPHIAHPAIRNRGTIGGSIAFADPAAELPACIVASQATLIVQNGVEERKIPASDFFQGLYETALSPHEILTAIELPITNSNQRVAFKELARRHGDYAIVGVCASCVWSERGISNLR